MTSRQIDSRVREAAVNLNVMAVGMHQTSIRDLQTLPKSLGGWSAEKWDERWGYLSMVIDRDGQVLDERFSSMGRCAADIEERLQLLRPGVMTKAEHLFRLHTEREQIFSTWQGRKQEGVQGGAILITINGRLYAAVGGGLMSQADHLVQTMCAERTVDVMPTMGTIWTPYYRAVRTRREIMSRLRLSIR